ncbi:hypothetical protein D0A34_10820 [Microcoleus vaginatus PCC 9802]|nr:hypothetical protein MicvaDRAFT_2180 [Microcoleus vaginatus FGP-2]UNU19297.1 hypothetical protein D0A34_10820 [Microcoleus vaginatus PCC 9802]
MIKKIHTFGFFDIKCSQLLFLQHQNIYLTNREDAKKPKEEMKKAGRAYRSSGCEFIDNFKLLKMGSNRKSTDDWPCFVSVLLLVRSSHVHQYS